MGGYAVVATRLPLLMDGRLRQRRLGGLRRVGERLELLGEDAAHVDALERRRVCEAREKWLHGGGGYAGEVVTREAAHRWRGP